MRQACEAASRQADVVVVARCRAAEIFADACSAELFAAYDAECANPLLGPTTPQGAIYEALEATGSVQAFAGYLNGVLCGFGFVILGPLPHYGRKFATVESVFVARVARHSGLGTRLMSELEEFAREAGCEVIFYSAPVGSRLARLLFLSDDYCNTNHVFTKRLR